MQNIHTMERTRKNPLQEIAKLLNVTAYIARQYLLIPFGRSRTFFTEFFTEFCLDENVKKKALIELEDLFPGIGQVNIQSLATFESMRARQFSASAGYLVSPIELHSLCAMVKFLNPAAILEIGTYKGWTTANLALNSSGTVASIDQRALPSESPEIDAIWKIRNIQRITADCADFDFSPYYGKMDFIFVDACHSEISVRRDTEEALKMLSPTGTIVWHDYSAEFPGVVNAVGELSDELDIFHLNRTCMAVYSRQAAE